MPKLVDHAERRAQISTVAARLIATGGLEAATIREIAAASGVSKGIVEHYFENKEELISGAFDSTIHSYQTRAKKATRGISGMAALRARLEVSLPMNAALRREWKVRLVFWSMAAIHRPLQRQQASRSKAAITLLERDIQTAVEQGEIQILTKPADHARRILFFVSGMSCAALHNPRLYSNSFMLDEIDRLLMRLSSEN